MVQAGNGLVSKTPALAREAWIQIGVAMTAEYIDAARSCGCGRT